jgi:hypothetical protein
VVLILRVMVNPVERAAAPRGASDELIRSLPTKRFKDGVVKKVFPSYFQFICLD